MITPEGKIKLQVKKLLDHPNIWYYMPVTNGMGAATVDFLCVVRVITVPIFFCIETKAPGKKPTPRQNLLMQELRERMNVICHVIDGDEKLKEFETWLTQVLKGPGRQA